MSVLPIFSLTLGLSALCAHATLTYVPIDITTGTGSSATQSTTGFGLPANNAIDGNFTSESHTATGDLNPSWTGNFGRDETFNRVVLVNRDDCCQDRFSDLTVSVLDSGGGTLFTSSVLNPANGLGSPSQLIIDLPGATTARSIQVSRDGASGQGGGNWLSIGELQVGSIADVILPAGTNLTQAAILAMTVAQNPTSASPPGGGFASNGVDNNFGNFTHTNADVNINHTWQVDFGEEMLLESVSIFNRSNCCGERLRDIQVSVLDGLGGTVFTSTILNPDNDLGFAGTNQGGLDVDFEALNGGNPIVGQTVVITRMPDAVGANDSDRSVLSLGEVQVFGGSIPEPSSLALLGLAAAGLFVRRRR